MSTLTGTKIKDTYPGLIKIEDNGAVQPTTLKTLTDGTGGTLPIQVSQVETKFTSGSLIDFTGTTISGLPDSGVQSVVAGTNVTVDATDPANPIVSAAGGGGGSSFTGLVGTSKGLYLNNPSLGQQDQMRSTYVPDTYGTTSYSISSNKMVATAMSIKAGQTINNFAVYISTAAALETDTMQCAIYKAQADNYGAGGLTIGALEYDFGAVDISTTGYKKITAANHTLGETIDDVYFLVVKNNSASSISITGVNSTNLSGTLTHMALYATTAYRGNTWNVGYGTPGIPANASSLLWAKDTGFPLKAIS